MKRSIDTLTTLIVSILIAVAGLTLSESPLRNAYASGHGHYFGGIPDVSASVSGVRLSDVRRDSPAEQAGLKAGDIIVKLGKAKIRSLDDFLSALRTEPPEEPLEIIYIRNGQEYRTEATLMGRR